MTYSNLSKRFPKHSYFCGWYYRCQSNKQTLAIIPSVHKTKDSAFCTIQVIADTHAFHVQFPYDDLWEDDDQIRISNNRFGKSGVSLDIHAPGFCAQGAVHFGAFTPIKYDIMGPFQYIPFMQCRHSVSPMIATNSPLVGIPRVLGTVYPKYDCSVSRSPRSQEISIARLIDLDTCSG